MIPYSEVDVDEVNFLIRWHEQRAKADATMAKSCASQGWPEAVKRNLKRAKAHRLTAEHLRRLVPKEPAAAPRGPQRVFVRPRDRIAEAPRLRPPT
ncbi:hypothetical protein [Methylobacterium sp. CM6247]